MKPFSDWLANTYLSQLFGSVEWVVPLIQTFHILGIAITLTPMLMLDVSLLRGWNRGTTAAESVQAFMPWFWRGLILLLISGVLLIISEPAREFESVPFRIKMLLVLVLACMMFVVQKRSAQQSDYWVSSAQRRHVGGVIGAASLFICVVIVSAGRLIAYVSHG